MWQPTCLSCNEVSAAWYFWKVKTWKVQTNNIYIYISIRSTSLSFKKGVFFMALCETTMKEECRNLFLSPNKPHLKSLLSSFVYRFPPRTASGSVSLFIRQRTISYKTPKTYQWKFTARTTCRLAIAKITLGPHTWLGHKWGHCVLCCRVSALRRGLSSRLLNASLDS